MTRDDSRALPFATAWLGPLLATLVGIGSTVELAAIPIAAPGTQLPRPTLIQQSPGSHRDSQQPAGTPRPPSAGESKPDSFIERHEALTAARERLEEVSKAAAAVAATGQLQQELAALRDENQLLRAELHARGIERSELETAKQAAEAHAAELTKTVEQATAKARELDQELVAVRRQSEQRVAAADNARAEAEARLSEMRDSLQRAEQEKARIGADLARVQGELATAEAQVAAAGQEHAQIDQRAAALEDERDDLRVRLADATARLGWSEAVKAQLENEVAELREAAGTAADDARQNLIAVETRIKELNEALAAIAPAAGPLETDLVLPAESGAPSAGDKAGTAPAPGESVAAVAAPSQAPEPGSADADRQQTASATRPGDGERAGTDQRGILGGVPPVLKLTDLPLEKRLRVQGLLADLNSRLDERGLMTTVSGELLFTVGSDEVQVGAYDTLAKVAELIRMYDDRQVLIIGHSDADGKAADNQKLSQRRAEAVKRFLAEYFNFGADRVSTEGLGEARPIASNVTPQGRRANRRVEVLILN
jgi:flagellar motor protein MotB